MRDAYDRSSKWLIERHGDSILRLAGVIDIASWRAVPAEVIQPRQLPDGLLEVELAGQADLRRFVVEIATFPEHRADEQAVRDALSVFLIHRELPELVTLVLHPKGQVRVTGTGSLRSPLGWTQLQLGWRVVELWTVPAADLLAAGDVGLIPWVPLARIDDPPGPVLQECRARIDRDAPAGERENLLAVVQVLGRLRYDVGVLAAVFGGRQAMIESPLIKELVAEGKQEDIQRFLKARFGPLPDEVSSALKSIEDIPRLNELIDWSARCPDLAAFHARLTS
jgi:hypothetical protein